MSRKISGFTLIELVVVIVVLGILSSVAIPQFVDLRNEARQGRIDGIAGALSSAAVLNYTQCISPGVGAVSGTNASTCDQFGGMISSDQAFVTVAAAGAPGNCATANNTICVEDAALGAVVGSITACNIWDAENTAVTTTFSGIFTGACN